MGSIPHTTKAENQVFSQTAAGTPMGEFLRRYWWPIAFSDDLKAKPTFVRLLSEDLVLFRDRSGELGLLEALCAHRRANLCLGSVTPNGVRCRYHGWAYDRSGNVLQVPGDMELARDIKQTAYSVAELGGLIFAYLGPDPVPLLPRLHYLVAPGQRRFHIQAFNNSNWVQHAENGVDPLHTSYLHGDVWKRFLHLPTNLWAYPTNSGVMLKHIAHGRTPGEWHYTEHPIAMPGVVFGGDTNLSYDGDGQDGAYPPGTCRWSVPIDDTHTMNVRYFYKPEGQVFSDIEGRLETSEPLPVEPYLEYRTGNSELGYSLPSVVAVQDATMLDGIGSMADRQNENLGKGDVAIALFRKMLLEQVQVVRDGRDPIGVIRDPSQNEMIMRNGVYRWIDDAECERILAEEAATNMDGGLAPPVLV